MRLTLDANEYIFGLGLFRKESCEALLKFLVEPAFSPNSISICRTIVEEVRANLTRQDFHSFVKLINTLTVIDEDFFVPFELGAKYESAGFKPADAFIAAYAEYVGADALVSENRHFLIHHSDLPFKVLTAEKCLSLIKHPSR